ncbi:hypothetical protein EDB83DRAFT_2350299 [Lactarius deliciosus]|nr:hypothetical protein EDB83DRAFT_2350299 [Lactarius deliciosus]
MADDPRFMLSELGDVSSSNLHSERVIDLEGPSGADGDQTSEQDSDQEDNVEGLGNGMDAEGFAGPKVVKPLTPEALAAFRAAQERAGVIYISRIPPGMQPTKVRHLMTQYGEVGREGWVEFKDKKIARSVADMLNAQPIGGKKGTRWRDDVWTLKYLPKFKWHMLTEQVAHEAAMHAARLRLELSQSRSEQREYLKNVELARVLDKREARSQAAGKYFQRKEMNKRLRERVQTASHSPQPVQIENVLGDVF